MSASVTIAAALKHANLLASISDSARIDVEVLLAASLQKDRAYLYTWPERPLKATEKATFDHYLQRRLQGEPIAYIMGEKEFWSLTLAVNNSTLIPRPETEQLVNAALSVFAGDVADKSQRHIIDLGTGTGAIALALASERPHWHMTAVDKHLVACALAEHNRQRHCLANVSICCSDWLESIRFDAVDMIVSNPPYIDKNDPHLCQGDVRFEPPSALIADHQGLADIEHIASQAGSRLTPHGWLLFEHGYQQAEQVQHILKQQGYTRCFTHVDHAGNPRVTGGQWL